MCGPPRRVGWEREGAFGFGQNLERPLTNQHEKPFNLAPKKKKKKKGHFLLSINNPTSTSHLPPPSSLLPTGHPQCLQLQLLSWTPLQLLNH